MKTRTFVSDRLYYGLDPMRIRAATSRALARVVGLPPARARVSATNLRQDFALDTVQGTALVDAFVAGGLLDPTKIEVKDLSRTWNDPLAASVRLALRQLHNFARNPKRSFGVPCVYSTEQQRYPDKDGKVGYAKPGVSGLSLDCNFGYGSSVAVTAMFGFVAAATAIERISMKNSIVIK